MPSQALAESASPNTAVAEVMSPNYSDYQFARPRLKKVIEDWSVVEKEKDRIRALRYIRVDKDSLEATGKLASDETYVATRLIDSNIRAEQPQWVRYITESRRAAVFKPKSGKIIFGIDNLEENFTQVSRYIEWEKAYIKTIDGTQTHGWDSVEVVFDPEMPGHFVNEHVGHSDLIFDRHTEDAQVQEVLIRRVKYTTLQLRANVRKFGFSQSQVEALIGKNQDAEQGLKDIKHDVFKCFYRDEEGFINVGWFHPELDEYILEPSLLYLGVNDISKPVVGQDGVTVTDYEKQKETEYPFYILCYYDSENEKVIEIKGRGYLDEPSQSSASAILSAIVNGTYRASQPYASLAPNPMAPNSDAPKQLQVQLLPKQIYDKPLTFWGPPYPPVSAIQAFQLITSTNKAETAKVDFAVENRKDSRKTATEGLLAKQQANELTGVQVVQLSTFVRRVCLRNWRIYQSRVLQGKIQIDNPELKALFPIEYDIFSSGDIDVLQRQEKLQKQLQAWPVISKTALAPIFLQDILRSMFPEDASRYIEVLKAGDARQLVVKLATVIQALVVNPQTGALQPFAAPFAPQLQQINQEVSSYLQATAAADQAGQASQQLEDNTAEDLGPLEGEQAQNAIAGGEGANAISQ